MAPQPCQSAVPSCDHSQRLRALTVDCSFIVQAPAGSGKTELLTQRYLALLGHAEKGPEEIVAITFTRKAANEMRQRIIAALVAAANSNTQPEAAHARHTHQLAQAALKRDQQLHWQLLDNPNRLRIQTIDSFCSQLVRQMPLLSHFGTQVAPLDNPQPLYRQAIAQLFDQLTLGQQCPAELITLLYHLDNDLLKGEKLFIDMLRYRDQWLAHIIHARSHQPQQLRADMESGLQAISAEQIQLLQQAFPAELFQQLLPIAQFAAQSLIHRDSHSLTCHCHHLPDSAAPLSEKRDFWLGICQLLLTNQQKLRQRLDKNCGFPANSEAKNPADKAHYQMMKQQMKNLLEALAQQPQLVDKLVAFQATPPLTYPDESWQIIAALLELLPHLVAQLRLVFQQHGQVDFIEIAQAALVALGDDEAPTDLALALDYTIRHLLIDEFQDTSIAQFHLLEKLTAGWQADDGRTLFAVGDPMQSIYRFRQAEVGLFLRAQQQGIGQIALEKITLQQNFRSTQPLVNWINQTFSQIFPAEDNIASGAITYSSAIARESNNQHGAVYFHALADAQQEAEQIVQLVRQAITEGATSIAILVKARSHLTKILPALQAAALPYQAVEIDPLAKQQIIQDLLSLTRALLHPADRIAWLALLRTPWCGLTLKSLHQLMYHSSARSQTVWQCINDKPRIEQLDQTERQRLIYFRQVMANALTERRRQPLRHWVEQTWQALHGEKCLHSANDQIAADSYFNFIDSMERSGDIASLHDFANELAQRYASSADSHTPLQILTIHKSKGLEFDTVIVAGLGYANRPMDNPLLLWDEQPRQFTAANDLILAPIKASQSSNHDAIYHYLKQQETIKIDNESLRLLYVAATRAKKVLHLTAHFQAEKENALPASQTLLSPLWPLVAEQFQSIKPADRCQSGDTAIRYRPFQRLPQQQFALLPDPPMLEMSSPNQPEAIRFQQPYQNLVGSVVHMIVQQLANEGLEQWSPQRISDCHPSWRALLATAGVATQQLDEALTMVSEAVSQLIHDERGRWLLQHYQQGDAELALTEQGKQFIIDRTFIDQQGQRWIIDYKISQQPSTTIQQQIQSTSHPWRQQLNQYAKLISALEGQSPRCALYFPLQPLFIELT